MSGHITDMSGHIKSGINFHGPGLFFNFFFSYLAQGAWASAELVAFLQLFLFFFFFFSSTTLHREHGLAQN